MDSFNESREGPQSCAQNPKESISHCPRYLLEQCAPLSIALLKPSTILGQCFFSRCFGELEGGSLFQNPGTHSHHRIQEVHGLSLVVED